MFVQNTVRVLAILYEDEHIQQLKIDGGIGKALLFRRFYPAVQEGDQCVVNSTATLLRLGTGGWDIVTVVLGREAFSSDYGSGHIIKGRYLPHQHSVISQEAEESPDHALFLDSFTLEGQKVLLAELHSMLPVIYCLLKKWAPSLSIAIIISDQAALPLEISDNIRRMRGAENLTVITTGQAFGGDIETVNLFTALQYAKVKLKADVIIVSVGPGVVGTGTYFGFSGMDLVNWIHTVAVLQGSPVCIPRLSFADKRSRHFGLSHHTLTPLQMSLFVKTIVPIPVTNGEQYTILESQAEALFEYGHQIEWVQNEGIYYDIVDALAQYPTEVTSMGRSMNDDPIYYLGIAASVHWFLEHRL